jgi:CheY-like chemotaxis protein
VLIAEDHPDLREMFRVLLEQAGHEIIEAVDGPTAVEAGLDQRPDAAFIDIGLPEFDGYEVARRLRAAQDGKLLLIAMSGQSGASDGQADDLFDIYLVKPVTPERMKEVLGRLESR